MRYAILRAVVVGACAVILVAGVETWSRSSHAVEAEAPSRLCVVWSCGDPGVAKNFCFMYTQAAKRR